MTGPRFPMAEWARGGYWDRLAEELVRSYDLRPVEVVRYLEENAHGLSRLGGLCDARRIIDAAPLVAQLVLAHRLGAPSRDPSREPGGCSEGCSHPSHRRS